MKFSKCHFFTKETQYLGHILSTMGIQPLPLKTHTIQTMHPPKMPKQICAFLILVGYYRKFIKNFAKIAKPLTLLTHQQVKLDWTPTHQEAFLKWKESIIEAQVLHYPDPNKNYISEGYFLQNRIIFDSVDKLSPVSNMAYSCLKKC